MARVGRLAGAILVETQREYFLVGQTKEPCDYGAEGFDEPPAFDSTEPWYVRLKACGPVALSRPYLTVSLEGEALARMLTERFVIERNGSVSERLWRLVINRGDLDAEDEEAGDVDARWLCEVPAPVWRIVRDVVLRCR